MSDTIDPQPSASPAAPPPADPPPPLVIPVRYAPPPAPYPAGRGSSFFGSIIGTLLANLIAVGFGFLVLFLLVRGLSGGAESGGAGSVQEQYVSGASDAHEKIAVIKLDGVIMEGATTFVQKEIDKAAADEHVKAVVLRINSPGGSITASDDLYRRIGELAQGRNPKQKGGPKPVVASMGAIAASGGYYVAMPAEFVMAEQTTITGSIGVYAAFPNVTKLADNWGFSMNVIKSDAMKDSGSMFHPMSPQERELWQDMVNSAYDRFLYVVAENRTRGELRKLLEKEKDRAIQSYLDGGLSGLAAFVSKQEAKLKPKLIDDYMKELKSEIRETKKEISDPSVVVDGKPKMVEYFRKRADGGIFMADEARRFGLIDGVGYQEEAVNKAAALAGLEGEFKVVTYERPATLSSMLFGAASAKPLDSAKLAEGVSPRLWYLAPQSDLAGILTAIGRN